MIERLIVEMRFPWCFAVTINPKKVGNAGAGVARGEVGEQTRKLNWLLAMSHHLKPRRKSEHTWCWYALAQALLLVEVLGVKAPSNMFEFSLDVN